MKLIFTNTLNMIKLNTVYKAGKQDVKFQEKEPGIILAEYGDESIEGNMEGNTLKGIFHNKKVNVTGLMELTFHETGFEGRWKKGLEPGELKQKWNAILVESKEKNVSSEFVKTGFHVFTDEDGIRYEGEWENDEFISGKAEYIDEDGVKVIEEGNFEQGNLKEGKITWADGNTASGTFDEELELNGKGIYTWSNGDFQDGTWVHGEFKDGKAKITHDDGEISEGIMKDGEWVEEEQEEEAIVNIITNDIENYESGSKYEGEFLNGIRHGTGIYTWPDGEQYEGEFLNGNYHGFGKLLESNGSWKEGTWENDEFILGKGLWILDSGATYEGERSQEAWNGKGTYTWPDGKQYEGEFLNGDRHGTGIYTWPDGKQYEGEFLNGNYHGFGKLLESNGSWKEGTWENDKFISGKGLWILDGDSYEGERSQEAWNGKGKYIWADGDSYEGEWKDGEKHGLGKQLNSDGTIKYEGYFTEGYSNNWYDEIDELIIKVAEVNGYNKNFKKIMGSIFSLFSSEEKNIVNNIDKAIKDLNMKFIDKDYISFVQGFTVLFYAKKLLPIKEYEDIYIKFLKSLGEFI